MTSQIQTSPHTKVTLDVETFSRVDLKRAGSYRYAEDESTDLLCVCWAVNDGPVSAWIPSADEAFCRELQDIDGERFWGPQVPQRLRDDMTRVDSTHSWKADFERCILNGPAGQRYGFPKIKIEQQRCSMARARYNSMPGSLEDCANALDAPVKKRVSGLNAMRYLCKPRKDGTRPTIVEERARFLQLVPYCADDVRSERAVDGMLPEMSPKEQRVWEMDQRINDRGVKVDLAAVDDMEVLVFKYKQILYARCKELTGVSPSNPGKLSAWIREHGFAQLENLQADTVRKLTLRDDVPKEVKTVLQIYATYNMKSVEKFKAMRLAVCKDGRLRGLFGYQAAGPGRWASYIVQLHNLFRSVIEDPDTAIEAAKEWDLDWLRALYPGVDPMKVIASCIRGMLIPEEGHEFVFPDFSGVEARWNAWMFDEEWKLNAYRKFDRGESPFDNYVMAYSRAFSIDPTAVTKAQRQLGKALELSMGYEGGVGAFIKMAATYRVDLESVAKAFDTFPQDVQLECELNYQYALDRGRGYNLSKDVWKACEGLKILWRRAHPKIVWGWKNLKDAANNAVANPGQIFSVAKGRLMFKVEGDFLVMRLPSGRKVRYYKPRLKGDTLYYEGMDTQTRMWGTTSTYGGKECENETQGGCRDLLADAMFDFEAEHLPIVMHVHDEPVLEVPTGSLSDEAVTRIMCKPRPWAEGFPFAIEGHRGQRYRK